MLHLTNSHAIYLAAMLASIWRVSAGVDYSQYVNPLIGGSGPVEGQAYGGGDIFVGGAVPFGVVKVGIDTYEGLGKYSTTNGGWTPKGNVTAISMMHESGTGGAPKYGIIPQMPLTDIDPPVNLLDNRTYFQPRVVDDTARVGYYSTQLLNGVAVELSGARHSGFLQYSFPAGEKHILVDVSHYLPSETGGYTVQDYLGGSIYTDGSRYWGSGTYGAGWNEGAPYTVYFCGDFDTEPIQSRTLRGRNTEPVSRYHTFSDEGPAEAILSDETYKSFAESGPLGDRVGAVFSWDNGTARTIKSRVGISFMSVALACGFRDDEIHTWNIDDTVDAAVKEWNEDVFSKIQVATDETANITNLRLLYSSLYFMHLMPSNRTGENPLWESAEPYWDDFYTMWDIFRCTVSLYHLIQPATYASMIRSLIDIWRHEGYMPDGRSGNYNGLVQGGSNADNVLADAYVKGLGRNTDDPSTLINWTAGYQAMLKDAEVQPYNTFSPLDQTSSLKEGRGSLYDWIPLGYVSNDSSTRSISKTVEYSLNDYALSVVAAGEGMQDDVDKYLNRSAGWQNIWNNNITHAGFTGFLAPRLANGDWDSPETYNPAVCAGCEWDAISYEAVPFEYSFVVPHDMQRLIELMGGEKEFERRLDYIFIPNSTEQDRRENGAGITTIMNIGNEPDFATPYLYNYLNKQYKSVNQTRALANQYFHDALYGVPGNSDAGSLNSWLIWQMLGFYPIVTQPVYLLESPWFTDINITIGTNKTLRITSNGNSTSLGQSGYFVQAIKVNGQEWKKNWFNHADIMEVGGTIEFTVGDIQSLWEGGEPPPSPAHRVLNPS
ncbi:hypothetical protein SLS53_000243 [Cytospora paraplurivora]|uniref:Glycoside hydrolase family 92 protein n=1 Tax=Cytospora paraplurivora TaxID=2898453 RepID=A0AAN9UNQ8_9PEZI